MYISSISLSLNLKLLLLGVASALILSGCTASRTRVQPYRERPITPEASQPQPATPQQGSVPTGTQPYQRTAPYTPQVRHQPRSSTEQRAYNRQVLQPIRVTVRGRVSFYAQRAKAWQELGQARSRYRTPEQSRKLISCQSKVSALHDAYTELQIQLFNDRNIGDSHEKIIVTLQHLQNRDFAYLEGECPALFKQLSAAPEQIVNAPMTGRLTDLTNSPQTRTRYGQSVSSPDTDLLSLTEPTPNYEERYQYAQSLLKQDREQEARRILSDLLASVRQTGNRTLQIKILKKISALEFALRNYLPARILYEELQQLNAPLDKQHLAALQSVDSQREKVDAYAALLLSSMTSNPEQDGFTVVQQARAFLQNYPSSPLHANVEKLATTAEQEAEQWFQGLLQKFDRLVANQQRKDALALLEKVPLDILPLDKQEIIQQRKNALTTPVPVQPSSAPTSTTPVVEQTPQPEPSAQQERTRSSVNKEKPSSPPKQTADTALQKKWDKAEEAFQATEYDKALALFSELLTTSLAATARQRMEKASLAAGQEARRKAANFFQRANSATDPKVRKQHLLSSKTLLEDILQKYPLAGLDAKVKRNLSRVDKELAALDHAPFE